MCKLLGLGSADLKFELVVLVTQRQPTDISYGFNLRFWSGSPSASVSDLQHNIVIIGELGEVELWDCSDWS